MQRFFLSAPEHVTAAKKYTNDEIIERVKEHFKGNMLEWALIRKGMKLVFKSCGSEERYLGFTEDKMPLDYAVDASRRVLDKNGLSMGDVDLVIYGGIYRYYFEPGSVMEVAGKLGKERVQAFDVTSACVGMLEAMRIARRMMAFDPGIRNTLICSADFPDQRIDYDIQNLNDLAVKSAGLTLGSGGTAVLVSRGVLPGGGMELMHDKSQALPKEYGICQARIEGTFISHSKELFNLGAEHMPGMVQSSLDELGWTTESIGHVFSHQPSQKLIRDLCRKTGIDPEKAPITHPKYGNNATSTSLTAMLTSLQEGKIKAGDQMMLASGAAGFSMVTVSGTWHQGANT